MREIARVKRGQIERERRKSMIRIPLSARRRLVVAIGIAALSAGVGWYGISAQAQGANPNAEQQLNSLRQQVAGLERRVAEVEKLKGGAVMQESASADARGKLLEQRLANLEKAMESRSDPKAGPQEHQALVTFTAPFVVVDHAGKPLMRVQDADESFSRGVYVFDSNGNSVAHMGVLNGAGRVYVSRAGVLPEAMMAVTEKGPLFRLSAAGKSMVKIDKESLAYYNDADTAIAVFGSKARSKGYLELNDDGGNKMVEAGSLQDHKGYVLASPYETRGGVLGDPSVLKGGRNATK
jgi:hypothetical protein